MLSACLPPYGWQAAGGELVPDAAEQEVIARMREMRGQRLSYGAIAEALNTEGTATRRGRWHQQTVNRALARPESAARVEARQ
jgi:hypothetical protein